MKIRRTVTDKFAKLLMGFAMALSIMVFPAFSISANAADTFVIDHFEYEVVDATTVKVEKFMDLEFSGTAEIPKTVKSSGVTYNVIGINSYAFQECSIKEVVIPKGITTIGTYAFYDCDNLISVVIPDSVTNIATRAFNNCDSLKSVRLSKKLTKIDAGVFSSCQSLTAIEIPEGVTSIEISAFSVCKQLKSVKLPSTLTKIDVSAFWFDEALESITIPASVDVIGLNAFYNCKLTKGVWFEGKVSEFGKDAFGGSFSGSKIVVPDEYYDYYKGLPAFSKCSDRIIKASCDAGEHTLKITTTKATLTEDGKKKAVCTKCKKVIKEEKIYAAKTIKLSKITYAYDGKTKKPTITVKDSKGKAIATGNYSVKYDDGRTNVGKYNVKITFKGDYKGSKTLTFTINPKATTLKSVTPASKAFTATWTKQTKQVDGYELEYALDDKFTSGAKKVAVTKNTTTSKKISSLKAKKIYYVRVRTYKKVGTQKYYSDWSKVLSVKTK